MADPLELLRASARFGDRAAVSVGSGLMRGGAAPAGRIAHKLGDPDEGQYFQLAFGFIPSGNLGTWLGVDNPYTRFALDAILDPFNAVNLVPFLGATTKAGRAAAGVRYLSTGERLNSARRVVQARGLLAEEGRGLELMSAVARNDVKTLRGMRDLFAESDEATLSFFRGKGGREVRNAIEAPGDYVELKRGLREQVQGGQRAAYVARIPFTDYELPLLRGEWLADAAQKTPYLSRWLGKVGSAPLAEIRFGLHGADAADAAFHSAEELASAGAQLAQRDPQLRSLGDLSAKLVADLTPMRSEYRAMRVANQLHYADLQTVLDRDEVWLNTVLADAKRGQLAGAASYLGETAAVAGSSDISSAFEPFLAARRAGLERLRDAVPGEFRRVFAEYDGALAKAVADPGKARGLAGPEALRGIVGARKAEVGGLAADLERGALPSAEEAGRSQVARGLRDKGLGALEREEAARLTKRGPLAARREELVSRLDRVDEAIEKGNQRAQLFRARRDLPAGTPLRGQAKPVPEVLGGRLNTLARQREALKTELELVDRQLAGGAEVVTERGAEKLTAQQAALGLPAETPLELTAQEKLTRGAAKGARAGEGFLAQLERALPQGAAKDAPDAERIAAVAGMMSDRLAQAARELPALVGEVRKLAGRTKLGSEPLVARMQAGISAFSTYVGIVRGGTEAKALRAAVAEVWPQLGKELERAHLATELPTTSRAIESDVLAAWNPSMSMDYGGEGRGLRNLYGAAPHPNNFADAHVAYEGQTMFRVRALVEKHAPAWDRLSKNQAEALDFMRGFKLSGREELEFLSKLDDELVGVFKSMRRVFTGAEAIGHGRWYEHAIAGYFPIVTRPGRQGQAAYQAALKQVTEKHRSSVKSRHFLPRISESLDDLLELEKKGILKVEKDPRKIALGYMDSLTRVAANQRLYDMMSHGRGFDGLPLLLEKSDAGRVTKALGLEADGAARYIDVDPAKFPALAGAKIHADHQDILQVFGPRNVSEVIREDTPFWRALMRVNLAWKGAVLSMSFFHTVAQAATIAMYAGPGKAGQFFLSSPIGQRVGGALGVKGPSVRLTNLLGLYGQSGEVVEQAIRHGMEWDPFDKLASAEFKGFLGQVMQGVEERRKLGPGGPMRLLTSPLVGAGKGIAHFNDLTHKVTWEYMHNSGKAFLYAEGLQRLMKLRPNESFDVLAKEAAGSANRALGGLNWRKMFGDARFRARLQAFMLAPDWTLANIAQARDFFVGAFGKDLVPDRLGRLPIAVRDITSPDAAGLLARRFWINWGLYGFVTAQFMNQATVGRFTWENPGELSEKFKIDLGRKDEKGRPIYLSYGKQFLEPFELIDDPFKFLLSKTAPVPSAVATIVMQRDRFGGPISMPTDSAGNKLLASLGWVAQSTLPIAGQSLVRAGKQFAKGSTADATRTLIGAGTGMFDIQVRPVPILEGQPHFEAVEPTGANADDMPRSLPSHVLPKRQTRFVFPRND